MKTFKLLAFFLMAIPYVANATCEEGVSKQIKQNGNLTESDRAQLMDDCNKFQDYRLNLDKYADGAYILNPGSFTCGKREDYIKAYNWVIDRGGKYSPAVIDKFKSCRSIKTPTLVAVRTQKDPSDPVVAILYANEYSVYYLHSQWVHGAELIPYKKLMDKKIK
jgi:hypothetical protein